MLLALKIPYPSFSCPIHPLIAFSATSVSDGIIDFTNAMANAMVYYQDELFLVKVGAKEWASPQVAHLARVLLATIQHFKSVSLLWIHESRVVGWQWTLLSCLTYHSRLRRSLICPRGVGPRALEGALYVLVGAERVPLAGDSLDTGRYPSAHLGASPTAHSSSPLLSSMRSTSSTLASPQLLLCSSDCSKSGWGPEKNVDCWYMRYSKRNGAIYKVPISYSLDRWYWAKLDGKATMIGSVRD